MEQKDIYIQPKLQNLDHSARKYVKYLVPNPKSNIYIIDHN